MPIAALTSELSPTDIRCSLIANGYRYVPAKGKRVTIEDWPNFPQDPAAVAVKLREHPDHTNTGILTGDVVAIDVDAPEAETAEKLIARVMEIPGASAAPIRTGRAPKCLYLFRTAEPREKASTAEYSVNGQKCQIEVLGKGQQFVAYGIHPDTHQPYTWSNGDPLTVPAGGLPAIDTSTIDAFLGDAEAILAASGTPTKKKKQAPARAPVSSGETFWQRVNTAALADADRWVPNLFPGAHKEAGTGAWRVTSKELGRNLEEDISIHKDGVRDFGEEKPSTPIQLAIEYGGAPSPKDGALWLCDRLGIDPATLGWEVRQPVSVRFGVASAPPEADNDDKRDLPEPPPMLPDPFNPASAGGLLREVAEWITQTAILPVPELSLAASAALIAGLFGGKALGPTNSGINLYLCTVMKTAGGKGHAPRAIRALSDKAGCVNAVSNGDPSSFAAFERILRRRASTVAVLDEFGIALQTINGKRSDAAAASIRKFLLAVYDQAAGTFDGRVYASSETKKDDSPIIGPALTVLGMTTPETLYKGITSDAISDGFLNRILFIESPDRSDEIRPPDLRANNRAPAELVSRLQKAITDFPRATGNLLMPKTVLPFEGGIGSPAHKSWEEIFLWQHDKRWREEERDLGGRAAENTIRLATVRAISRRPERPEVSVEDIQWGWAITNRSISIISDGVANMAESEPARLRKAIVKALGSARNGEMYRSKLMERAVVKEASIMEYKQALEWLYASGKVLDISSASDGSKLKLVSG